MKPIERWQRASHAFHVQRHALNFIVQQVRQLLYYEGPEHHCGAFLGCAYGLALAAYDALEIVERQLKRSL